MTNRQALVASLDPTQPRSQSQWHAGAGGETVFRRKPPPTIATEARHIISTVAIMTTEHSGSKLARLSTARFECRRASLSALGGLKSFGLCSYFALDGVL